MKFLHFSLIAILISMAWNPAFGQDDAIDRISSSIKAGSAKAIAGHFDANVEITLPGNEGYYSEAQSEQILKDFFQSNKPVGFSIMHKGDSGDAMYVIGSLTVESGQAFRTFIYLIKEGDSFKIQQLKFTDD